jgi:DNA-binding NarL/FixJ family response regulator
MRELIIDRLGWAGDSDFRDAGAVLAAIRAASPASRDPRRSSAGAATVRHVLDDAWTESVSETLRRLYKLTTAEIEIVRAIVGGKIVKQIARDRDRSTETVRTQVRSILSKTGTHSQAELACVALRLMAGEDPTPRRRQRPASEVRIGL